MELWQMSAVELAQTIRVGRASSREAVQSVLGRMDAVNAKLNAVVRRMDDEALAAADTADALRAKREPLPLHGVPVTVKVNTDQKGHPTDNGVVAFKDVIAPDDAPVVANLRAAGAIVVGRTNVPAFSMRAFSENELHGRTQNPRDRSVTPGGSSGGAASAVAAGIGAIGHGNDIAGSVRFPAFCCGIVGLRVGLGRIPSFNHSAKVARGIGAQLMATQGPLTRTVGDARLALRVMAKGDPRDTRWVDAPLAGPLVARPIKVAIVPRSPAVRRTRRNRPQYVALAGTWKRRAMRSRRYCRPISKRRCGCGMRSARATCCVCCIRLLRALARPMPAPRCANGWRSTHRPNPMRSSMRSRAATCCCGAGWSSSRTIPLLSCRHIATCRRRGGWT
jgi:Asp-tRNA(Asn)/Glu-tRNA(Gln) amidotransferase A subunit family amidase